MAAIFSRVGLLLVGSAILAFVSQECFAPDRFHFALQNWRVQEILASNLSDLRPVPIIADAREPDAYAASHIPQAIPLSEGNWDADLIEFLNEWTPTRPVVVYCGGGTCGISKRIAVRLMNDLPQSTIYVLKGGYPAWQNYQAANSR